MITDDGCELWTSATGRGEPILCCHGGPGLWDMFGTLDLGPRFGLIRWDQRGAGRSEARGPYTLERMVADVDAVREWHGLDRVPVLGHSWGAHLGLLYALARPERVSALVYVSGVGLGHDWHAEFKRNFERVVGEKPCGEGRERALWQWTADFVTDGARHAEAMATPWFPVNYEANTALSEEMRSVPESELVLACESLRVPTLIVDGVADNRPRWAVDSLEQALPSVRRVRFENVGHVPWLEAPDKFRSVVTEFLTAPHCSG
ncbi:alpha/beta fold hydrolase [Amycolatopsis lurida]|uniref:alpha/beta fold hydrolase n=1 Tax=Amycolatopsis lurida TaxID=31959 RepID=UPI00365053E8